MRTFPAIRADWTDARGEQREGQLDLLLADADDFSPMALEELPSGAVIYFTHAADRDRARAAIAAAHPTWNLVAEDVPDEDWAARSQASLTPVRVGDLVVAPPWSTPDGVGRWIEILPSMGFGTGHHASTRLCLSLLQDIDVRGADVTDVGTGSGVLAIAAALLGARSALALDFDPDAVTCAEDNVARNGVGATVTVRAFDVTSEPAPRAASVVFANLTGGLLIRSADALGAMATPEATLILSGIMNIEDRDVISAFERRGWRVARRADEDDWVGLRVRRGPDGGQTRV
ncbi:MAG TPA: 50S ribosomal protein L11 methyltransferase [Vicinamibacterales bacterium]|nr:50S ribosomal protein L11 methyltransferase [Vicinamibacterales bacterium]